MAIFAFAANAATDSFLGAPFKASTIDAGANKEFHATLVRYPFTGKKPKAAVLYVHGFNDYFFQKELAQKVDSAGFLFFAIDLHGHGRSLRPGERRGFLRDVSDYYAELDSALSQIRSANIPIILLGHSTGGLIVSLYAADRENGKDIAAIALNSPFLEMNMNWFMRELAVPAISKMAKFFPDVKMPTSGGTSYGQSLHRTAKGEWDYNLDLKTFVSPEQDMGWIRAVHKAHRRIQNGLQLSPPILVMHSSCSIRQKEWDNAFTHCDGVLNVDDIVRYGATLGPKVSLVEIPGGLHDLFLSAKPVRENAYRELFRFLNNALEK